MLLAVRISSYGCTWEVWRALKKLEFTHLSCSPNFPRASITRYTHVKHEQILNFHVSNLLSIILFADDTNIFLRHNDLATLATILNEELSHVSSWFNANKLTVHPAKSKFIIFHPRRKQINSSDINIFNNNSFITRVQEDKFLGIIFHENLSWKPHISAVCDKVSKVIGVLCKSRRYLPLNTLKTLYNSLSLPYINLLQFNTGIYLCFLP